MDTKKKQNLPRRRFPGFTGEWEEKKLGEITKEFKSGVSIKSDKIESSGIYPVYGGNGLRGYTETFNHDGEFALIGRQGALCGNMNYSCGKAYFTEHAVAVQADENNNTKFLYYLLGTMNLGQYSDQSAQPGLAVNRLVKLKASVPVQNEQKRIADFLSHLDSLISLQQQELDQWKTFKRGMLQQLFPREGEKVPRRRFPGFTGEWEEKKLGKIATFTKGAGYSKSDLKNSGTPIILYGRLYTNYETVINKIDTYAEAKEGSVYSQGGEVIVPGSGETAEDISRASVVAQSGVLLGGDLNIIHPSNILDPVFLALSVSNGEPHLDMARRAQGKSIVHLHNSDLEQIKLYYPSIAEQRKISNFFSDLDSLISLHQQELEQWKKLKKGMLQQLFV